MSRSVEIRSQLGHPVIDADGHWIESTPLLLDVLRDVGGARAVDAYRSHQQGLSAFYGMTPEERLGLRSRRVGWWTLPSDTRDRATAMLPALLRERLEEFGFDVAIMYPTLGLLGIQIQDEEYRRAFCRAINVLSSQQFSSYQDSLIPAAVIPTFNPEEAIDELRYAVNELQLKVAVIGGSGVRPIPAYVASDSNPAGGIAINGINVAHYIDNLALDTTQDFDPFWQEFVDLKVAVTSHVGSQGWVDRRSPTNFTFNHVGHFAQANHNFAKAVLLGGVTHRFPALKFAFLEGGAGWAVNLYMDLLTHSRIRGRANLLENLRPSNLDMVEFEALVRKYGGDAFAGRFEELSRSMDVMNPNLSLDELSAREGPYEDFAASHVEAESDLKVKYAERFFFGCEADDPMTAVAYDDRMNCRLKPIFSSDIGHMDVTHMNEVLEEAFELVEHGYLSEDDFREFTFSNAVLLHGSANPDFFSCTVVDAQAKQVLSEPSIA